MLVDEFAVESDSVFIEHAGGFGLAFCIGQVGAGQLGQSFVFGHAQGSGVLDGFFVTSSLEKLGHHLHAHAVVVRLFLEGGQQQGN